MSAEQRRQSTLEYVQRAATLVSVDALALDVVITDASANVAMLCDALHRALTHGLLPAPTATASMLLLMPWRIGNHGNSTNGGGNSNEPTSLWSALQTLGVAQLSASARDAVQFIAADVAEDESRAAALVRWLLNERAMEHLMRHLFAHAKLAKLYEPDALVRREDAQSVLSTIAAALSQLQFRLCVGSSDHHAAAAVAAPPPVAARSVRNVATRGSTVPSIDGDEPVVPTDADDSIIRRRRPQQQLAANPTIVDDDPVDSTPLDNNNDDGGDSSATAVVVVSPQRVTSPPMQIPLSSSSSREIAAAGSSSNQSDAGADVQLEESSFNDSHLMNVIERAREPELVNPPVKTIHVEEQAIDFVEPVDPIVEPVVTVVVEPAAKEPDAAPARLPHSIVADSPSISILDAIEPSDTVDSSEIVDDDAPPPADAVASSPPSSTSTSSTTTTTTTTTTKEFRLKKNKTKQGGFVFEVKR